MWPLASNTLLTGSDKFALQRHLRVHYLLVSHPALCRDDGRIAKRAEEHEFRGGIHVELSPALKPPRQFLLGFFVLRPLTRRVHASEPRGKRVRKIAGLLGGQTTRVCLRRHLHSIVQDRGRDFPQTGLDTVSGHRCCETGTNRRHCKDCLHTRQTPACRQPCRILFSAGRLV